jgi:2-methylisocitrate lyase-like PEP mutase family enzyme
MGDQQAAAVRFLDLHDGEGPLLLPNPWDRGTARLFEQLGYQALATTSSGFAATRGRLDGYVTRDEVLAHNRDLVACTDLPISADLENGFADEPGAVAETVRLAAATGLAGCSIEDYTGPSTDQIYDAAKAAERIVAAAEAAHGGDVRLVLTARAENHLHGRPDLADTIARLESFQEAGADVLYAPGIVDPDDIRAVVTSVDRPVNVLAIPGVPPVADLARLGVKRVSVGGGFSLVALAAVTDAARELIEHGTYGYWDLGRSGRAARAAFVTHEDRPPNP